MSDPHPMGCSVDIYHSGPLRGMQANTTPVPGAPAPALSLTLVFTEHFLTFFFFFFSLLLTSCAAFCPFLNAPPQRCQPKLQGPTVPCGGATGASHVQHSAALALPQRRPQQMPTLPGHLHLVQTCKRKVNHSRIRW